MGCCNSTPRDDDRPLNPTPSTQPTSRAQTHLPQRTNPPSLSPTYSTSHRQRQQRSHGPRGCRPQDPSEIFNRPLLAPKPYRSKRPRTRKSLDREREEFFDTAITGRREVWDTLKAVTELLRVEDLATAQGILDAAGVTLPDGDLVVGGCYDEIGNFYQLGREVVRDPENLIEGERESEDDRQQKDLDHSDNDDDGDDDDDDDPDLQKGHRRKKEDKGKGLPLKVEDTLMVKARLSDRGGPGADIKLRVGKQQSVRQIIKLLQQEAGLTTTAARNSGQSGLRLAYLGKILKEGESLMSQGYKEGNVVNALVFSRS